MTNELAISLLIYMFKSWIVSLLLTLIIEILISLLLGIRKKYDIFIVMCANICTNPVVVFISNCVYLFSNKSIYVISVIILELFAFIFEYIFYAKYLDFEKVSPLLISLITNSISFGLGLIVWKENYNETYWKQEDWIRYSSSKR